MSKQSEIWELIEPVVSDEGLSLYDVDYGSSSLKVFIAARQGANIATHSEADSDQDVSEDASKGVASGITIDHCAKISRRISMLLETEWGEGWNGAIEVSSPGINRRLRRPEHFLGAVGERIRVLVREGAVVSDQVEKLVKKDRVLIGVLTNCTADGIDLNLKDSDLSVHLKSSDIDKAKVDFVF